MKPEDFLYGCLMLLAGSVFCATYLWVLAASLVERALEYLAEIF